MFNNKTAVAETVKVELRLQSKQQSAPKLWISCQAIDSVCVDRLVPQVDDETRLQLEQHDIQLADNSATTRPIDILIGLDHLVEFQTHKAVQLTRTLEVVGTVLGWTLFGRRNEQVESQQKRLRRLVTSCLITKADDCDVSREAAPDKEQDNKSESDFRRFVEAEAYPIEAEQDISDHKFLEDFLEKVEVDSIEHRFVVRLPFKEQERPAENKNICLARLRSLESRLARTGLREKYNNEFQEMIRLGFIEKVDESQPPGKIVSYLPHREVIKEDSLTTKLRIVFDASTKKKTNAPSTKLYTTDQISMSTCLESC